MNLWATKRSQHITAVLLYLVIVLIFMGGKLNPGEGLALGKHDTRGLFVPWLTLTREALLSGSLPLWDAYQFAGNPFLSNPQVALFYPPTWMALIPPVNVGISWHVAFHMLLAATGMYLFVRQMSAGWSGAFIAGLVYTFSGFTIARIWAGHIGLLATNAWLPWILLGTFWAVRRRSIWSAIIAGVPWGMAILAGHSSSLFYLVLIWAGFLLYLAFERSSWLLIIRQAVTMFVIGAALSSVQLLPFIQLGQHVARSAESSYEFASAFSLPLAQLITLLVPDYFGDPLSGYWGAPYFEELTFYTGVIALLSFVLIYRRPSRLYGFYLLVAIVGLLLALGSNAPFYRLVYEVFPPIRLLRGPARAGILFVFAAAGLLGDIINHHRPPSAGRTDKSKLWLRIILSAVVIVGTGAMIATSSQLGGAESVETVAQAQIRLTSIIRATIFAFAGILLIWWITSPGIDKNTRAAVLVLLAGVIIVDLWGFGYRLVTLEPASPHAMWQDAREIIGQETARVLPWGVNIFDQNGAGQVGLKSVFGYNTLEPEAPIALAASRPDPRSHAYDALGVGYVLANVPQDHYGDGAQPLQLIGNTDNVWVYKRDRILPEVRLAQQYEVIPDTETALERIHQDDFDPETTVILNEQPSCELSADQVSAGLVEIEHADDGFWQLSTSSSSPALLIISETAYPGWQVNVDGDEAQPLLAYTALRAVCVPAGEHIVIWEYKPMVFIWGGLISLFTLLLIAVAVSKELSHE